MTNRGRWVMNNTIAGTQQKALAINRDPLSYGSFAEIGAGQEVARWFFHVGGAAATVAKTISAYDMKVSTGLYGTTSRYVSRQRLELCSITNKPSLLSDSVQVAQNRRIFLFSPIRWQLAGSSNLELVVVGLEFDSKPNHARILQKSSF